MKRFVVTERGQAPLPPLDLDGDVVIGSGPEARLRLPAAIDGQAHASVKIAGARWIALAEVVVGGAKRGPGESGAIGDGIDLEVGDYRVRIEPAPANAAPSLPQRTESLARELVRGLLGNGAAPVLELVRGPNAPSRRELPPPEATIVIGRGDEATWIIVDEDLSREHAEIVRGWDGVTIRDLGSKNGTRVDGERIAGTTLLSDGARIELASCELVFRDPAERHLRGSAQPVKPPSRSQPAASPNRAGFMVAAALACAALAGLVWVLAS